MRFSGKNLETVMGKGHYAVTAATILDVGRRIEGYDDIEEIKGEQEFQLRKKMKKQIEKNRNLYGNINQGEVVFNLLNPEQVIIRWGMLNLIRVEQCMFSIADNLLGTMKNTNKLLKKVIDVEKFMRSKTNCSSISTIGYVNPNNWASNIMGLRI